MYPDNGYCDIYLDQNNHKDLRISELFVEHEIVICVFPEVLLWISADY